MDEVTGLMQLLVQSLRNETRKLNDNDIRLLTIGQLERFPESCQRELREAIDLTRDNKRMNLCLALSYSGRWDITQAVRKLAVQVKQGKINPEDISDDLITSELVTAVSPIRTSLSGPAASFASAIFYCGSWLILNCISPIPTGRISGVTSFMRPSVPTRSGNVDSAKHRSKCLPESCYPHRFTFGVQSRGHLSVKQHR